MKEFREYRDDPVAFVREVLGGEPWAKQVEILEAVRDEERVTVRSCHAVGKSYSAACCVLWWLHCFEPATVLTTAPSDRQVKDVLWRQIRRLQNRARVALPGHVTEKQIKISEDKFAVGFSTDESDRFQGYHSPHLLIVVDEAAGVLEPVYEGIDGCLMTEGGHLLLIGNPTSSSGRFHASHRQEGWRKIVVSAFDSPNVAGQTCALDGSRRSWPVLVRPELITARQIVRAADDWGIDTPIFQARILGDFPDVGDDTLFPLSWIEAANRRFLEEQKSFLPKRRKTGELLENTSPGKQSSVSRFPDDCLPIEIGVDVARYGGCETVVVVRHGTRVTRLEAWMGQDLMTTAGRVVAIAREEAAFGDVSVKIDEIGMGGGPLDRLREPDVARELKAAGIRVYGVNVAERPRDPERYERRRDEILFSLRDRFRSGQISVPPDDRLTAQLTSLRYRYTSRGRLQVESKEDLRERGLRSPDRADALALAFAPLVHGAPGYAGCGHGRAGVSRLSA